MDIAVLLKDSLVNTSERYSIQFISRLELSFWCRRFSACGGTLTGEAGSLSYPQESTQTYPHGVDCAWVISTIPDKVRLVESVINSINMKRAQRMK
jgi:hypothetical protein